MTGMLFASVHLYGPNSRIGVSAVGVCVKGFETFDDAKAGILLNRIVGTAIVKNGAVSGHGEWISYGDYLKLIKENEA